MVKWVNQHGHINTDQLAFTIEDEAYGPLHTVHHKPMGATWAHCVLGPDIAAPGGILPNNKATATGEGWNTPWTGMGYPTHTFNQDQLSWVRAHLINAEWGGPGNHWSNLTILSSQANSWHRGIENHIRNFLSACRAFDLSNPMPNHWIGVEYHVIRSVDNFAVPPELQNDLYSYCPSHIVVKWRAVSLPKIQGSIQAVIHHAVTNRAALPVLPPGFGQFPAYNIPQGLAPHQVVGNYVAGAPALFGPNANNFDQDVEIHNV